MDVHTYISGHKYDTHTERERERGREGGRGREEEGEGEREKERERKRTNLPVVFSHIWLAQLLAVDGMNEGCLQASPVGRTPPPVAA